MTIRMWREPQQPPAPVEVAGSTYTQDAMGQIEAAPEEFEALHGLGFRRVLLDASGQTIWDSAGVPVTRPD